MPRRWSRQLDGASERSSPAPRRRGPTWAQYAHLRPKGRRTTSAARRALDRGAVRHDPEDSRECCPTGGSEPLSPQRRGGTPTSRPGRGRRSRPRLPRTERCAHLRRPRSSLSEGRQVSSQRAAGSPTLWTVRRVPGVDVTSPHRLHNRPARLRRDRHDVHRDELSATSAADPARPLLPTYRVDEHVLGSQTEPMSIHPHDLGLPG